MSSARYQRLSQLYETARTLAPEERVTYLETTCGGDEELGKQVHALLSLGQDLLPANSQVSHYTIDTPIGAGGMGQVYLATDTRLDRKVVVKVLPGRFTTDADRVRRFVQEAKAASALNHPHVITIYDIGQSEAGHFIVMEFVDGQTLRAHMKQPCAPQTVAALGAQIAQALAVAHDTGITHRDIKPENVMVRNDGYVKVLDFGLARLASGTTNSEAVTLAGTQPGSLLGTVRYMSPEQARSEEVATSSDIFSLGVVFYEMATGHAPFHGESLLETLNAITSMHPTPPSHWEPALPAALEQLILRMLAKDPLQRPRAADVGTALQQLGGVAALPTLEPSDETAGPADSLLLGRTRFYVGREKEAAELRAGFASVAAGQSLLLCVAGEPGIGKTTIIESFLAELNARPTTSLIGRGRCSERLAGTEAYLPWLEGLERLLRDQGKLGPGKPISQMMRRLAPTWYAQLPHEAESAVSAEADRAVSQERLKRELHALLQELSRQRPVVFFLDDLQWSDASTVDLLAYIAGRFEGTRLLLLVSYRPSDLLLAKHLFLKLRPELQARGVCRELTLEFLTGKDIEEYLALQFPNHDLPKDMASLIHSKTEGNPLFMVDLVRYLSDRGVIAEKQGRWRLAQSLPDIAESLPESVRGMIERKISYLSEEDKMLLVAASVQGYAFDAAVVARALGLDPADVDDRLERIERMHALVRVVKEREFPDGTLTLHLRFVHLLYQNALYTSVRATRKTTVSRSIAEALESFYGTQRAGVANELALLWETARDFQKAAAYFQLAAHHAGELFAARESLTLAERGLAALSRLPDTRARQEQELLLQLALGHAVMTFKGYGAPEVEQAYKRARTLCRQLGDTPYLIPATYGLYILYQVRTQLGEAQKLAEEMLAEAQKTGGPELVVGHWTLGIALQYQGRLLESRHHFEQVLALYDPATHRPLTWLYAHEPAMVGHGYLALTLWLLGYPDQALEHSLRGLERSREIAHVHSQAHAYCFVALMHLFRRESVQAESLAATTRELADREGLVFWSALSRIYGGSATAQLGKHAEGIQSIRTGLEIYRLTGAEIGHPYYHTLVAEAYGMAGQPGEGLTVLAQTETMPSRAEEIFFEAELHRVRGALLRMEGAPSDTVEPHFQHALNLARDEEAKALELRAAMSLSSLWLAEGKPAEARALLEPVYSWFTEGFETQDLRAARALLDQC